MWNIYGWQKIKYKQTINTKWWQYFTWTLAKWGKNGKMEFNEKTKNCTQTSAFHEPTNKKSNIQKTNVTQQIFTLRSKKNWETYRQQRNFVNKLRWQSIRNYFVEHCTGSSKQKDFWPTIKPFLTNKDSHFQNNIILSNNDEIINNQSDVAEIFINYFVNAANIKTLAVKVVLWMIIIQAFRLSEKM